MLLQHTSKLLLARSRAQAETHCPSHISSRQIPSETIQIRKAPSTPSSRQQSSVRYSTKFVRDALVLILPSRPLKICGWHCRVAAAAAAATEKQLQSPHGGQLQQLLLPQDQVEQEKSSCSKSMELSDRNACDVELLCVG